MLRRQMFENILEDYTYIVRQAASTSARKVQQQEQKAGERVNRIEGLQHKKAMKTFDIKKYKSTFSCSHVQNIFTGIEKKVWKVFQVR